MSKEPRGSRGRTSLAELRRQIGARIAQRRHDLGWKQRDLAARIGASPGRISTLENGHVEPNVAELLQLGEVLGTSLDELLTGQAADTPLHGR
jgi:transcriptional regulator with XRE-family HTH domain